jgi:hypothetical protein
VAQNHALIERFARRFCDLGDLLGDLLQQELRVAGFAARPEQVEPAPYMSDWVRRQVEGACASADDPAAAAASLLRA